MKNKTLEKGSASWVNSVSTIAKLWCDGFRFLVDVYHHKPFQYLIIVTYKIIGLTGPSHQLGNENTTNVTNVNSLI